MLITKCPLRISLAGGSTDLQSFLNVHKEGSVISFPTSLYTYITFKLRKDNQYRVVYSKLEQVDHIDKIRNDVAREVLKHFDVPPCDIAFNADIPSTGSGLASSSSYTIALIKAVISTLNIHLCNFDICTLALDLERRFNPLTGYQDAYGCGLSGIKKMVFDKYGMVIYEALPSDILDQSQFYLVPTNIVRQSTDVLSTIDVDKCKELLVDVSRMEEAIRSRNVPYFSNMLTKSWEKKKLTSPAISNPQIEAQEKMFKLDSNILGWKLCGAGGGGYFLIVCSDDYTPNETDIQINMDENGVTATYV